MVGLELILTGEPQVSMFREDRMGKVYDVVDYWESAKKVSVNLPLGHSGNQTVTYALAPQSWINFVVPGEKYGFYIEDMMFVSSKLQEKHPDWVPYVVLKLFGEKRIDSELDRTGRARHWQSLFGTIRVAGETMDDNQLYSFLSDLIKHERSGFFQLDGEVKEFMERYQGSIDEGRKNYLNAHHKNIWVQRGRANEDLAKLGINFDGFRNHAETIVNAIAEDDSRVYPAFALSRAFESVEDGSAVILNPPYNSIAYFMTKDGNNLVSILKFIERKQEEPGDLVLKLPKKGSTWSALIKRLQFLIQTAEQRANFLSDKQKTDALVLS